jgi:hypothetical protein
MNPFRLLPIVTSVALFACGNHSVDLDASRVPTLTVSADPDELGVIDEQVQSLAVDSERLYWVGSWPFISGNYAGTGSALRSCEKANCPSTLVTYENGALGLPYFAAQDGQVYWVHPIEQESTRWALLRCPAAGCDGPPLTIAGRYTDTPSLTAFDANTFYFYSSPNPSYAVPAGGNLTPGLYRDSLSERDGTPQLIHAIEGWPQALQVSGDYLYWIEAQANAPYWSAVQRMRSDGSQPPESLTNELELEAPGSIGFAVNAESVFWTQGSLRGSIARCPLTGCVDPSPPDIFLAPVRLPEALLLDDSKLYWQNQTAATNYGVSSCSLANCTSPEALISGVDGPGALAIDDDYVYTATSTDSLPDPGTATYVTTAHIRRVAKGAN